MTVTDHTQDISPDEQKKQRKKLAKREARLMLQVEEARKDIKKSEQKAAKAQKRLDEYQQVLCNLELQLRQMRENQVGAAEEVATTSETSGDEISTPTSSTSAPEELSGVPVSTSLEQEQASIQAVAVEQSETTTDEISSDQNAAPMEAEAVPVEQQPAEPSSEIQEEMVSEAPKSRRSRAPRRSRTPKADVGQDN